VVCIKFSDSSHVIPVNRDVTKREHPEILRPLLPEIKEFGKHNHFNVLHPILRQTYMLLLEDDPSDDNFFRLIASSLELPEDTLVNNHGYDAIGETWST